MAATLSGKCKMLFKARHDGAGRRSSHSKSAARATSRTNQPATTCKRRQSSRIGLAERAQRHMFIPTTRKHSRRCWIHCTYHSVHERPHPLLRRADLDLQSGCRQTPGTRWSTRLNLRPNGTSLRSPSACNQSPPPTRRRYGLWLWPPSSATNAGRPSGTGTPVWHPVWQLESAAKGRS
jgi:hypothetical protein